ncbi:lipopolysaccharide core heptosyltransferase RfaQ [Pectobacterium parmentieri]|uniref:Lipopolysaccharide core heptosyltransferase RfaQ n=1 Tax=Pectobacterium parmentieri TaxID=1905730 RepID=A0A8B3FFU3_PECPM|nr:lipopolysaccharide core heptosyltransferase RfaQ [Pectobacterium parmentieri]AOR61072.1 putative lipopolysaccharide heptosyltransferase III [Pectobacterium parmentieri]AYH12259.1 lipopolysaccharide core heptosyltransferase RfaQ [Pectobacterium parmentieri]AYH20975.1 lipopolysaccharide core heptosyltransferase RfaQ [Pectobacterium parmentieri]AYH38537.1 lipopolysaccharide core heptosyltransferase RfaQ [Pectobacterium parmentieri]AZS58764.1 lipopolysaccharide core heptosyltransferase RfaQ [Pe
MSQRIIPYHRILVVKLRYHGDMLLTTPLISTLKANYPDAKIDVLLYQDTMPILSANPEIHQLYGLKRKTSTLLEKIRNFTEIRQVLKQNNYDLIVNLADQWPIALLVKSLGARSIAIDRGDNLKGKMWRLFFSDCVPPIGTHIVEQNRSILSPLGLSDAQPKDCMSLYYSVEDAERVFSIAPQLRKQAYVVIQPTARQDFKCWDNDKFAVVIDYLKEEGLEVVLTCGPSQGDLYAVQDIHAQCIHKPNTLLAGKTSFLELAALIDNAALYIGVDSAPMHMAAALNTPLVCLFGPTDHKKWRPWSDNSIVIWAGDYQPMPERKELDRNQKYLSCIPAQDVIHAVSGLLAGPSVDEEAQ